MWRCDMCGKHVSKTYIRCDGCDRSRVEMLEHQVAWLNFLLAQERKTLHLRDLKYPEVKELAIF